MLEAINFVAYVSREQGNCLVQEQFVTTDYKLQMTSVVRVLIKITYHYRMCFPASVIGLE